MTRKSIPHLLGPASLSVNKLMCFLIPPGRCQARSGEDGEALQHPATLVYISRVAAAAASRAIKPGRALPRTQGKHNAELSRLQHCSSAGITAARLGPL